MYGYSRTGKTASRMAGTKCKNRKLDKEEERGAVENRLGMHLREPA
jgi:hypothetical protein